MKRGGKGGGNTITGLRYECKVDLAEFISAQDGYEVKGENVLYEGNCVAHVYKKHAFYRFLKQKGVDWRKHISRQLIPDNAIYVIVNNTMHILEVKTQERPGSVDEKLQTCDFKKKQYQKLLYALNMDVRYIYILDDWFRQPKYKDVLDYIISVGCQYYFNYVPLFQLGLPMPHGQNDTTVL